MWMVNTCVLIATATAMSAEILPLSNLKGKTDQHERVEMQKRYYVKCVHIINNRSTKDTDKYLEGRIAQRAKDQDKSEEIAATDLALDIFAAYKNKTCLSDEERFFIAKVFRFYHTKNYTLPSQVLENMTHENLEKL